MKAFLLALVIICSVTGCRNKKAEIVDAMKVAKQHVDHATEQSAYIKELKNIELQTAVLRKHIDSMYLDSLIKESMLVDQELRDWKPVYDSPEMELKKY